MRRVLGSWGHDKERGRMMEVFSIGIDKIQEVEEGKRVVFATIDTSFYDGKHKGVQCAFLKSRWDRIKATMQYQETEIMNTEDGRHMESLTEEEWCRRFERDLRKVPDKELAEEVNRRAKDRLFHKISFKVEMIAEE